MRFRPFVFALLCACCAAAQVRVEAWRIAGLPPSEWPPGDGPAATAASLTPSALTFDRAGNLLIADTRNNRVRKLSPDGAISTTVDGARYGFKFIVDLACDSRGNLYLSDSRLPDPSQLVRISPDGGATVIDGIPSSALPPGIALDVSDNLYITDHDGNVVWKRTPAGTLQKVAGSGKIGTEGEGGPALAASLLGPRRLAFDARGNLLIADAQRVLRVNPDGTLVKLAGGGLSSLDPTGMAAAPDGALYIASMQFRIWRRAPDGDMSIIAGTGDPAFTDGCALSGGVRLARNAALSASAVVLDAAGRLYVADSWNSRVRRIDPDGRIHTAAGSGPRPVSPDVLYNPSSLATDAAGNVYFAELSANRVRRVTPAGHIETIAGVDSPPPAEDPACYTAAGPDVLSAPRAVALDGAGNLFIADTGNNRILRRAPDGAITAVAEQLASPFAVAADDRGDVYVYDRSPHLYRISPGGRAEALEGAPPATALAFSPATGLILNGYRGLFEAIPPGPFLPFGPIADGPVAVDSAAAIYIPTGTGGLHRVTQGCHRDLLVGPWGYGSAVAGGPHGDIFISDFDTIWHVVAVPPGPAETPSPSLPGAAVRNAASNLAAIVEHPSPNPFHPPIRVEVNDAIAPGEILRLTGTCLGPLEPASAGSTVLIGDVPAPLLRVQSAEILAIAPRGIAGKRTAALVVDYLGGRAAATLDVQPAVPGIFTAQGTLAAALNQDLTLNEPGNAAPIGSVVALFLTGAGLTDPPLDDGVPPEAPFPPLALPVEVWVSGTPAEVLYAGAAPGLPGVAQVNIRIPATPPTEAAPLKLTVGGIGRDQRVTLSVKP